MTQPGPGVFTTLGADWQSNSAFFVKMLQNVPDVGLNSSNLFLLTMIGERQKNKINKKQLRPASKLYCESERRKIWLFFGRVFFGGEFSTERLHLTAAVRELGGEVSLRLL